MSTDLQRRALLADLTRHLAPLSHDALRILDEFAMALLQVERERPIVLEALARQIVHFDEGTPVQRVIAATIHLIGDALLRQDRDRAELREQARDEMVPRWPAHGLPAHPTSLGDVWIGNTRPTPEALADIRRMNERRADAADDLLAAAKARVDRERHTAAVTIGLPGDDLSDRMVVDDPDAAVEFSADRLTAISPVPAAIARTMTPTLDEDPQPYDSIELEWDVSDIHAGEGT